MKLKCGKAADTVGFGACTRIAGHDGPCAHPSANDPINLLDGIRRWSQLPAERREFVLFSIVGDIQQTGRLADEADKRGMKALSRHYRDNQKALELAATVLSFGRPAGTVPWEEHVAEPFNRTPGTDPSEG